VSADDSDDLQRTRLGKVRDDESIGSPETISLVSHVGATMPDRRRGREQLERVADFQEDRVRGVETLWRDVIPNVVEVLLRLFGQDIPAHIRFLEYRL
jgi:hypothetical protein